MDVRRTLDEVCTIYEFEPGLKDLFVEGDTDKDFIEWYVWAAGLGSVAVYTIETVDIQDEVLLKHGLPTGSNRSRVLALAGELAARHPEGDLRVLCLADRDFEDYQPSGIDDAYVVFTDCNSLELYGFTPANLRKFTTVALGGLRVPSQILMALLLDVLQQLFALRLANQLLGWGMEWIPFAPKYIDVQGAQVMLRRDAFIRAYLQKGNRWHDRLEFMSTLDDVATTLSAEDTRRIRGHDFCELLMCVMRKMSCSRRYTDRATLEGALMAAIEHRDLEELPFFRRISSIAAV